MKRGKLIRYLRESGCSLLREGGNHSVFINPLNKEIASVPRHAELGDFLAEKICKQLRLPKIKRGK
ncbi:addiction module toxin, HicA family [Candidatus Kaiserbacteria bacterium RIFCSPLOWO2_01_FULL_53_17]|uniref:Addiction module toxin, HicA family n=1 Tax=Candidatus Kaiserbacteria bacterium RIFCSPLOWO2_01_FULL_53_17 TaxID=1798511 RepID=A0A1F6EH03_9BACT|nr:MAG: addiction module toxin, HicA family [Candidatus Kaiserbacteria bacterium RIFCSPLOWO2_01_FULL_53_17]